MRSWHEQQFHKILGSHLEFLMSLHISAADEPDTKQMKRESDALGPSIAPLKASTGSLQRTAERSREDLSDDRKPLLGSEADDLPSCQIGKQTRPLQQGMKCRSPSRPLPPVPSGQCQYSSQGLSPYLQGAGSCDQVYYPHHSAATGSVAAMAANSGLLAPTSSASLLSAAGGLHTQNMAANQASHNAAACALQAPTSSSIGTVGSSAYGLSSQGNLPSCTYMQGSQSYAPLSSMMNFPASSHHFPNLAWSSASTTEQLKPLDNVDILSQPLLPLWTHGFPHSGLHGLLVDNVFILTRT